MLIIGIEKLKQKSIAEIVSILANIINKKVAKTKIDFLGFNWNNY